MQDSLDTRSDAKGEGAATNANGRWTRDRNIVSPVMRSLTLLDSFRYAFEGVAYAFSTQRNFRLHTLITILTLVAGLVLQISLNQWAIIAVVVGMVFQTELTNTAVEALVDKVSPEWHGLAKVAKDCSAAAVLMSALASVAAGLLIFVPRIISLLGAG